MSTRRILVIEDDSAIRRAVVDALESEGYRAVEAADGEAGLLAPANGDCDLVLLDLVLPGTGGLEVLAELRETQPALPVIILTAKGDESDRVRGLRLGADDYVVKPFSVKELLARVAAVLRRTPERAENNGSLAIPEGVVDFARCEVRFHDGRREELSQREVQLLSYLVAHADRPVSRDEILNSVWGLDPRGITTRTIDMHIARTREKLRDTEPQPRIILTVRGKGYMLGHTNGETR
jgi:DNA-binding response OmpR family regulator